MESLSGLLEPGTFELNSKNVRKDYEAVVLSIGEFDERVFLDSMASMEIGTPSKTGSDSSTDIGNEALVSTAKRNLEHFLIPSTPLSGKQYLRAQEQLKVTPVSQATLLVSRLTRLLANRDPGPSAKLVEIFKSCAVSFNYWKMFSAQNLESSFFCSRALKEKFQRRPGI